MVRHEGYAGGGDTTLGLYKLQIVAVEEGLFVLRLRLAAAVRKSNIDHHKPGLDSSILLLFVLCPHKPDPVSRKYAASRPSWSHDTCLPSQRRRPSPDGHDRHPVLHGVHIRHRGMPLCSANSRRRDMRIVDSGG